MYPGGSAASEKHTLNYYIIVSTVGRWRRWDVLTQARIDLPCRVSDVNSGMIGMAAGQTLSFSQAVAAPCDIVGEGRPYPGGPRPEIACPNRTGLCGLMAAARATLPPSGFTAIRPAIALHVQCVNQTRTGRRRSESFPLKWRRRAGLSKSAGIRVSRAAG